MKKIKCIYFLVCLAALTTFLSCRKQFLDEKPNASLVVPTSIEDFQSILDNIRFMNGASAGGVLGISGALGGPNPALLETATDNYYIPDSFLITFDQYYKSVYTWSKGDPYGGLLPVPEWSYPYKAVFYANVVLDGLNSLPKTAANQADWNRLKGSALFYRAHTFYQLAQAFAPLYEKDKANGLLGIPLRLKSDISEKSVRSTLEQTYTQIINDLNEAATLLPNVPLYKTRPSLPAVYGLLSRVYLSMSDYGNAKIFAEKCLTAYGKPLLNFNTLSSSASYPMTQFNDEVLFSSIPNTLPNIYLFYIGYARIDSTLYSSFQANDLRKDLFFRLREPNAYSFRGSYDGNSYPFFGIAIDEIYFVLSESLVRLHDVPNGLKYLNELLQSRFKATGGISTFVPYVITDEDQALRLVLTERRKELIMRGLRLTDLRRLNKDPRFSKSIYRNVSGQIYELPPNDLRYTWPIPDDVIALTGMQQNPR